MCLFTDESFLMKCAFSDSEKVAEQQKLRVVSSRSKFSRVARAFFRVDSVWICVAVDVKFESCVYRKVGVLFRPIQSVPSCIRGYEMENIIKGNSQSSDFTK